MTGELIMVVEDDPLSAQLLTDVLQHHGYRVLHANSGEEALRLAERAPAALVLLDIHLPGIDGTAVLDALRSMPAMAAAKAMALTASVMPHEIAGFLDVGFDAFHSKPVDLVRLVGEIEALLQGGAVGPGAALSSRTDLGEPQ